MKRPSHAVAIAMAICCWLSVDRPASAAATDVTGTWEITIHYPSDGDYTATYVLKQDGETITGQYHGRFGPADVTGTIKANDVTLTVTVQSLTAVTARFSGKLTSATKMSGTVTGTSERPSERWSAEKKP
jgi:hypothetical protein